MTALPHMTGDELATWFATEGQAIVVQAQAEAYYTETETGVAFEDTTPYDVWQRYLTRAFSEYDGLRWRVGDALVFGERKYGEMYAQALDDSTLSYSSLTSARYVAARVESCRRRQNLPWSWHADVAALSPAEQVRVLALASEMRGSKAWDRDDLRAYVRTLRQLPDPPARLTLVIGDAQVMAAEMFDRLGIEGCIALMNALKGMLADRMKAAA